MIISKLSLQKLSFFYTIGNRMDIRQLSEYLDSLSILKEKYKNMIEIRTCRTVYREERPGKINIPIPFPLSSF